MAHMASTCIIVLLFVMIFYTTTISALNITKLLSTYPEFSTFNDLLTKTGLDVDINERASITVLVVDNSGMGSITSKPEDTIKKILSTHALLQYFDMNTLAFSPKTGSVATNFFQNSGIADKGQGQTRVTSADGEVVFASTAEGAPDTKMVKIVVAQPYVISVIQLAQPIVTPGLDQIKSSSPSASSKAAPPAPVMATPPKADNATETPAEAPAKVATPEGHVKVSPVQAHAKVAPAEGPAEVADAPVSESPSVSRKISPGPGPGPAPAPAPEGSEDDKEAPPKLVVPKNGGAQLTAGVAGSLVAAFMALFALSL